MPDNGGSHIQNHSKAPDSAASKTPLEKSTKPEESREAEDDACSPGCYQARASIEHAPFRRCVHTGNHLCPPFPRLRTGPSWPGRHRRPILPAHVGRATAFASDGLDAPAPDIGVILLSSRYTLLCTCPVDLPRTGRFASHDAFQAAPYTPNLAGLSAFETPPHIWHRSWTPRGAPPLLLEQTTVSDVSLRLHEIFKMSFEIWCCICLRPCPRLQHVVL